MRCIDLLGGAAVAGGGAIPACKMERVPAIATPLHLDKLIIRVVLNQLRMWQWWNNIMVIEAMMID